LHRCPPPVQIAARNIPIPLMGKWLMANCPLKRNAGPTLLEMVMEIYTFMRNLPRTGCAALFIAWGKKFGWENLHVEMKMLPCMEECNCTPYIYSIL
jgi:hypothetical protein